LSEQQQLSEEDIMNTNTRRLLTVLGALILVAFISPLLMGGMIGSGWMMGPNMMWGNGSPGGPPGMSGWSWGLAMVLGSLGMLAFWGALIIGVVLLVRWLTDTTRSSDVGEETAIGILQRRYAAGEIAREEYEQMRQHLER
jgi:putative membrane protein